MALVGGLVLLVMGLRRRPVAAPKPARQRQRREAMSRRTRTLLVGGVVVGVVLWLVTGWVIAVVAVPAIAVVVPALLLINDNNVVIARLEAMEEWSRSLASVLSVGVGLEQALIRTLKSTPPAIQAEVGTLVARLRARWRTEDALRAFADDLNDLTGDQIASSLMLGATRRGAGLASVLEGMAATVADDVRIRRAIEADRAKPRTAARWITVITLGVLVLVTANTTYVAPYGSALGQLILLVLLGSYLACLMWMRSIAKTPPLPRFLQTSGASGAPAGVAGESAGVAV